MVVLEADEDEDEVVVVDWGPDGKGEDEEKRGGGREGLSRAQMSAGG